MGRQLQGRNTEMADLIKHKHAELAETIAKHGETLLNWMLAGWNTTLQYLRRDTLEISGIPLSSRGFIFFQTSILLM